MDLQKIGLSNVINAILVHENVRPAMLIHPNDVNEVTHNDPKTKYSIDSIVQQFPSLQVSTDYTIYQGAILSKQNYNGQSISLSQMGELLGYPCYKDFETKRPDSITYTVVLYAKMKNGSKVDIFANVCNTQSSHFNEIAKKATEVLQRYNIGVVSVHVPPSILIAHLLRYKTLDKDEIAQLQDTFFNFGFSDQFQRFFKRHFQLTNPIHQGIILDLLVRQQNDTLSPFYPLQYHAQYQDVLDITKSWEMNVKEIILKSKQSIGTRKRK